MTEFELHATRDWLQLCAAFASGMGLGLAFFWGLWATLEGMHRAPNPASRMLLSLILRFGSVTVGFYLLAKYGGGSQLLMGALGFTVARVIGVRRARVGPTTREGQP